MPKEEPRLLNHLMLLLEDSRQFCISTETESTDSMLCRDGGFLIGRTWDRSKVKAAKTFITEIRG